MRTTDCRFTPTLAAGIIPGQNPHRNTLRRYAESNSPVRRMVKNAALTMLVVLCFVAIPTFARASCGIYNMHGSKAAIKLPAAMHNDLDSVPASDRSIVGLWHVVYTGPDQSIFLVTFDTWHSDGTEFESAFVGPATGNLCVGVWKLTRAGTVKLHHVGWLFNPATLTGTASNYFTIDEVNTVASDGRSYTGTFTFKVWNLDGTPTGIEVTGSIAATRITVD